MFTTMYSLLRYIYIPLKPLLQDEIEYLPKLYSYSKNFGHYVCPWIYVLSKLTNFS